MDFWQPGFFCSPGFYDAGIVVQFEIFVDCSSIFATTMIKLNSTGGTMEWLLMAALAFVVGGLIGVKFGRQRTDLRQRKSALEWEKSRDKK